MKHGQLVLILAAVSVSVGFQTSASAEDGDVWNQNKEGKKGYSRMEINDEKNSRYAVIEKFTPEYDPDEGKTDEEKKREEELRKLSDDLIEYRRIQEVGKMVSNQPPQIVSPVKIASLPPAAQPPAVQPVRPVQTVFVPAQIPPVPASIPASEQTIPPEKAAD